MAEAFVILTGEIQAKSQTILSINSNKGKALLVADEYTFKLNKATTTTKYWICTINDCAAKVHTDSNNRLMKTVANRSHLPGKKLKVRKVREKVPDFLKMFLIFFSPLTFQLNFIQQNMH